MGRYPRTSAISRPVSLHTNITNMLTYTLLASLLLNLAFSQDAFQKCCGDRKLYYKGECYSPLTQGPCGEGQWLIMERGGQEWDCKRTYLSLPFGLISDKTTPQDPVWADCTSGPSY